MSTQKRQVSIVGSSFFKGAGNWIAKLRPGQQLRVEREPQNRYDPNACGVFIFQQQLGYFPRGFAGEIAPHLDAGGTIKVTKSADPRFAQSGVVVVEWETSDVPPAPDAAPTGADQIDPHPHA